MHSVYRSFFAFFHGQFCGFFFHLEFPLCLNHALALVKDIYDKERLSGGERDLGRDSSV